MIKLLRICLAGVFVGALVFVPRAELSAQDNTQENSQDDEDRAVVVSDNEKRSRTKTMVSRMKTILSKVFQHLADAREEQDVVKLVCVNEIVGPIRGLLRISELADVNMQDGISRGDTEMADFEFEKILIAFRKCEQYLAEAEACVGGLAVYSADFDLKVEFDDSEFEEFATSYVQHPPPSEHPPTSPYQ